MFISDGASDEVNGLINFSKRKKVASVLTEVMKFQETYYCLLFVRQIRVTRSEYSYFQDYLLNVEVWSENTLYDYASYREPKPGREKDEPPEIELYKPKNSVPYPEPLTRRSPNPPEYHSVDGKFKRRKSIFKKKKHKQAQCTVVR